MTRATKWILIAALLTWTAPALAGDLTGQYTVRGTDPGTAKAYTGTAEIAKHGANYMIRWQLGKLSYEGTGIVVGDILSVAYTDGKGSWFGVVAYRITRGGHVLEGKWAGHRGDKTGTDILTRKK